MSIFLAYAIAFLIGSRLIYWDTYNHNLSKAYDAGTILTVFFAVITGVFGFTTIGPVMKTL